MRLWHYKLIPFLPNSQLVGQWRELNMIYKHKPNHILINYVYTYPKSELYLYSVLVEQELIKRGINFQYSDVLKNYFSDLKDKGLMRRVAPVMELFKDHHTNRYLLQCFYNLQEKFDRGQKDFSKQEFEKLVDYVKWIDD